MERTLGMQWHTVTDRFEFAIVLPDKPCTRKGTLSTVSSIYDPLGFVAPLLLDSKSLLQELCRLDADWDEKVPPEIQTRWLKWKNELCELKKVTIPRLYKPGGFGPVVRTELHHFFDASTRGYGQCSYLRLINDREEVHCSLVIGKSRVAPLRLVTIPRLDLTAAVCSVRVSNQLKKELEHTIDDEGFWTDSRVFLGYIANESKRFHVFVANRVQEIQNSTSIKQWNHVKTKQNPADEASRGLKAGELQDSRWLTGPEFLWRPGSEWQDAKECLKTEPLEGDPEVKKSSAMATTRAAL
ncbi:uncharacterized protein LOC116614060 [Nematostella vectensis]|uniref:uncharacterized protein LOC116614060 n=1 Tax=Nematostella vectensis TaxID=45351 RepID=UPI00138FE3E5|nr:uncharacterized protein LOC116614060 [Nematostella vectensis]